jgi:multidrug efflux pump
MLGTEKGSLFSLIILYSLTNKPHQQRYRFNRYISATVTAGVTEGNTLGDGLNAMYRVADRVYL